MRGERSALDNLQHEPFSIGVVFDEFLQLVGRHWLILSVVTLVPALFYAWIDSMAEPGALVGASGLFGFVILYFQVMIIVRLARDRGLLAGRSHEDGSPTLGKYFPVFGQSILWSISVFFGLLLLVIPGVWLITIWFVIVPVLIVEDENVSDAFGRSRALVTPHFWQVLILVAIIAGGYLGALGALFLFVPFPGEETFWIGLLLNLVLQAMQTGGWVLCLATYIMLAAPEATQDVEDVFA